MAFLVNGYLASLLFAGHCYSPADITDKTHHDPCPYGIYILVHLARKPAGWRCGEGGSRRCGAVMGVNKFSVTPPPQCVERGERKGNLRCRWF